MQWLDADAETAWEATLNRREREQWEAAKVLLDEVGPEMRWRIAGRVMRTELDHARKVYRICLNVSREAYKAELVKQNGRAFREAIGELESRLAPLYDILVPLRHLIPDVERAHEMLVGRHQTLSRVTGSWDDSWPGAAKGRGISGYDTPEGVARVGAEVKAAHERYLAEQAAKPRRGRGRGSRRAPKRPDDSGQGDLV